jgi:DNA-binding NarL/FixJ family response regulator
MRCCRWKAVEEAGPLRAVVCDDDPVVRHVVSIVLRAAGYEVSGEAATAIEVTALAEAFQPQVVVLDLSLSGIMGIDEIPRLKAASPGSTVVVFSAFESMRPAALAAGADCLIDKTSMGDLEDELRRLAAEYGRQPHPLGG